MENALTCEITNQKKDKALIPLIEKVNQLVYDIFQLKGFAYYDLTVIDSLEEMQQINNEYRHKDYPTDVISLCLWDQTEAITPLLGEIFICLPQIKQQAKKYDLNWKYEFIRMLTHSILHLFDFHHEADIYTDKYVEIIQTMVAEQIYHQLVKGKK